MRHILTIILFSFFSFTVLAANFNTTGWKTYLSYNNTNSVEESNDQVFVVAEGSLYTYGKDDNSIKQYYKGNGLNDNTISLIRYNKQTKSLLIIYDNSNIDILEGGVATNLPYLSTSTSIRDKQINSVLVHDEYAYLSTAFGIVVVNMAKKEIKDTYKLSLNITSCAIQNGNIYASTTNKAEDLFGDYIRLVQKRTYWIRQTGSPMDYQTFPIVIRSQLSLHSRIPCSTWSVSKVSSMKTMESFPE